MSQRNGLQHKATSSRFSKGMFGEGNRDSVNVRACVRVASRRRMCVCVCLFVCICVCMSACGILKSNFM